MSKKEGSGRSATKVALGPFFEGGGTGEGAAFAVAWIPFGAVIGATHGALAGVNEEEVSAAIERLRPITDYPWIEQVKVELIGIEGHSYKVLEFSFPVVPKLAKKVTIRERASKIPRVHPSELDLSECKIIGADTLLVLNWERGGLGEEYDGVNPKMSLGMVVKATIIRAEDHEVLGMTRAYYRGNKQMRFMDWAGDEDVLKAELQYGSQKLAEQIAEWLKSEQN